VIKPFANIELMLGGSTLDYLEVLYFGRVYFPYSPFGFDGV